MTSQHKRYGAGVITVGALCVAVALLLESARLDPGPSVLLGVILAVCGTFAAIGVARGSRSGQGESAAQVRNRGLETFSLPVAGYLAAFFVIPVLFLGAYAVGRPAGFGGLDYGFTFENFHDALQGVYRDAFVRTVTMAATGTVITIVVGFPFAYWLARYAPPRHRLFLIGLVLVPFLTAFLIRIYALLIVLADDFVAIRWLHEAGLVGAEAGILNSGTAVLIGLVYNYLPLFVLPVFASLDRFDWSLARAASDLGASPWRAFVQVTLPLSLPGVLTGTLLVFIPMMGEYLIPQILGGGNSDFMGNLVARSFLEAQNYSLGASIGYLVIGALVLPLGLYVLLTLRSERGLGA